MRALRRLAPWLHSAFYISTGVWPLVHLASFEKVTGPKVDKWLVRVVGLLVLVQGVVTLIAAVRGRTEREVRYLAMGTATCLAAADVKYASNGRISPVYFLDAVAELLLVVLWSIHRSPGALPREDQWRDSAQA